MNQASRMRIGNYLPVLLVLIRRLRCIASCRRGQERLEVTLGFSQELARFANRVFGIRFVESRVEVVVSRLAIVLQVVEISSEPGIHFFSLGEV